MLKISLITTTIIALFGNPVSGILCFEDTENDPAPSYLLAEEFIRIARLATMTEPLDIAAINAGLSLAIEATKLAPDDSATWRVLHEVAQMADRNTLSEGAIEQLFRLNPSEPTMQLARLRNIICSKQTADQRIALYEQLLSESGVHKLNSTVAARLALDAAHLQRQLGDINQFARWLAESVALDPSYPDAIALAAGFFGDESADVFRRAELLSSAMLSNIRDATTQVVLAEFLMAFGDYQDAKELYEIVLGDVASDSSLISHNLLADIAMSQWAAGDGTAAMDTLTARQIAVDEVYRRKVQTAQPRLTPLELARIHSPLVPKLSVLRAAIYADQADNTQAEMAMESAISSLLALVDIYKSQGDRSAPLLAETYVQTAWTMLWLENDVESAIEVIERVEKEAIIGQLEKQRLNGWIAFRQGDTETAKRILTPLTNDPGARAGLALVYLSEGNKRSAAIELLDIAKKHGGTLLGVWSRNKLQEIIAAPFNIRPEIIELQQLMSGVFKTMDPILNDPRPPVGVNIYPETQTFNPYQPIYIRIELKNNTTIPLTIASNGPIQPLVLLEANIEIPTVSKIQVPPIIISIENELSILPGGSTSIIVDLRTHWIGGILDARPLRGASITLRATVNFTARESVTREGVKVLVYESGRLGKRNISDPVRINGIRLNDIWLQGAIEDASNITDTQDLISFVLLTWVIKEDVFVSVTEPLITPPPGEEVLVREEGGRHPLQDQATSTLLTVFPKLDVIEQAWVLSTMSDDPILEAFTGMLKEPDNTISQLAWIIRFATPFVKDEALDDPILLKALQSENEQVKTVATWVYGFVQRVAEMRGAKVGG